MEKNKIEIMKTDLENARKELSGYKDRIRFSVEKEIDTQTFERNCMNDLAIMTQLKQKIATLEFYLSLK
jgi:hypothetical protein